MRLFDFMRGKEQKPEQPKAPPVRKTQEQLTAEWEADQLRRWGESRDTGDLAHKFRLLTQLSSEGFAAAQYDLANMYGHGEYVEQDWEKARELYLQCYDEIPYAALSLGQMGFGTGWKVKREDQIEEGIHFYSVAAGRGIDSAFSGIHRWWHALDDQEENWIANLFREELEPIIKELEEKSDAPALDALGLFYQYGVYFPQDLTRAKVCFERAVALKPEDPYHAALMHLENPIFQIDDDDEDDES